MRLGVLVLLSAAWLALSGPYTVHEWLIFVFGVVSVAFVWRLSAALDRAAGGSSESFRPSAWLRLPRFMAIGTVRVGLASIHVTRLILFPGGQPPLWLTSLLLRGTQIHPRLARLMFLANARVAPRLTRYVAGQQTPLGQVLYANFITLTPGTITLDLRNGELLVYALDPASEAEIMDGSMNRDIVKLEGGSI